MFGGDAFGAFGFSEHEYTALDTPSFEAFLADVTAERCWLLELDVFSLATSSAISAAFGDAGFGALAFSDGAGAVDGGVTTLRFSSHGYTSKAADTPASTWYEGRLEEGITVDRRIAGRGGVGGLAAVFAEASLVNADGGLDTLTANYALDGRAARILVGDPDNARSTFGLVFSGVVSTVTIGMDSMRLKFSDGLAKLDRAVNQTVYAGTGGLEGGADLTGKPKPKGWGKVFGISPPLVDSANLIYQVHDGLIQDVTAVYDRGIALTKVPGAPAAGQYQVTAATGTFKLGATPSGTVTCDAECDATGTYIETVSDIVRRILTAQAGLVSAEIDATSFAQLNTDAPAEVGIWAGTDVRSCREMVEELLGGSAYGGFSRYGAFTVGQVKAASGTPEATYTGEHIVSIERLPLPAPVEPIVWRTMVAYQRNYTVQSDLAAAVTAAQRTFAAEGERVAKAEDSAIKSRHLLAVELGPLRALYRDLADASAEATRLFLLWSVERKLLQLVMNFQGLTRDIGQVIQIEHPRLGLAAGAPAFVLAHVVHDTEITLTVLV